MVLATVKVRSSPCSPCSGEDALRAAPRGSGSPLTSAALHGPHMVSGRKASRHFSPSPPARAEQKAGQKQHRILDGLRYSANEAVHDIVCVQ